MVAGRWRSLVCSDLHCCPIEGQPLPELDSSRVAAEQISLGNPLPFGDEAGMIASLESFPVDPDIQELISKIPEIDNEVDHQAELQEGAAALIDLLHDFESDGICRDKGLVALVLVRLRNLQIRDFALGSVTEAKTNLYFDTYRWLMRSAPVGYIAPIASVFAAICYERGDGAMAQRVLSRALADDEKYQLAILLKELFARGKRPEIFREMRAELHPKVCDLIFSGSLAM